MNGILFASVFKMYLRGIFIVTFIVTYFTSVECQEWDSFSMLFLPQTDFNTYFMYTRKNPNWPQYLEMNDNCSSINSSNFDPNLNTVTIAYGWQSQPELDILHMMPTALLDANNVNVIVVDWTRVSSLGYVAAVSGVPDVGKNVGRFLQYISSCTGVLFSSMHLVGHSLGAHVVGNAGNQLQGRAARITGLDPAGPLWYTNPYRLMATNAIYVEAMHTNAGVYGIDENVGDVDFYVNDGISQPGCFTFGCDHLRALYLYAATVTYPDHFIGNKCSNITEMRLDQCEGSALPLGNDDLQKTGSGIYRVNTGGIYPY